MLVFDSDSEKKIKEYNLTTGTFYICEKCGKAYVFGVDHICTEEMKRKQFLATDLCGKCGSCAYAVPIKWGNGAALGSYVECKNKTKQFRSTMARYKQRTALCCKKYKERKEENE